ncbi:acyl-homoserine-lactone synthase [Mesorhizobium sp. KR9-304]|uniref:acyl-homoserine-lactone synthase n=1 Tax=Mesorhizobium sp. KR9-304 TaxID=3156614 RepID=UPI0032B41441
MVDRDFEIVTVTDLRFERILNRAGWPMTRIGEAEQIGRTVAVAGIRGHIQRERRSCMRLRATLRLFGGACEC